MCRERSVSPVIGVILMVVVTVLLSGAIGAVFITVSPSESAEEPDPSLNISTNIDCFDHMVDGDRRLDCNAHVFVEAFGDAERVDVRAVDAISYETKDWSMYPSGDFVYVYVNADGAGKLVYGDAFFVRATFENGSSARILTHEFSCEDVTYRNACRSHSEGVKANVGR